MSGALVSGSCEKKQPSTGSRALQGETLLFSHSLGRTGERGEGSQGVQSDGKARFTLEHPQKGAGKGRQEKGPFLAPKSVSFTCNPTMFSTQKSQARTCLKKPCISIVFLTG